MRKCFMLDIEVITFIITLLGNKRLNTQNDTQVIKTVKVRGIENSHKETLYWLGQTTCLRLVPNKLVEIYSHNYSFIQASPSIQPSSFS